ncbi:hypothetical protein QGP82_21450 [Leptothoe sp. LEGE 181152]|nr:hypothetical protein [Leptothoe sp. LEGE 181152]
MVNRSEDLGNQTKSIDDSDAQEKTEDSFVVGQNIRAEGDVIFENITRTSIEHQTVIKGEVSFEEVSVDKYSSKDFESPESVKKLVTWLETQRVLIISGDRKVKKPDLASHIASLLKERKSQKESVVVKKSIQSLNVAINLQREFFNSEKATIFILPDLSFKTFGIPLSNIKSIAEEKNHYVIGITDESKEAWRSDSGSNFFCSVSYKQFEHYRNLLNKLSDENLIREWYYDAQKMDSREHLLVISLSFFNGLYGDQFFSALEQLVEKVWQKRDSSLRAPDYCDLDKITGFFNYLEHYRQEDTVEVESSKRQLLLKIAWGSHRRQILAALPILASLVKDSVKRFEYELYGTPLRRQRLRQAVAETLSNIGLIAGEAVEDTLLKLAADEDINVQAVAANALAWWRDETKRKFIQTGNKDFNNALDNPDKKLFSTIQRWQEQQQLESLVSSYLSGDNYEQSTKPQDYIRSTIALTVGYAAEADPYDQMSEELIKLLRNLMLDTNKLVRSRILEDTLPRIVRRHTKQIKSELEFFLKDADYGLFIAISRSLAAAYKSRPKEVLEILDAWQQEAKKERPAKVVKNKVTIREILLSIVVLTYGELELTEESNTTLEEENTTNVDRNFANLQEILSEEIHPFVRTHALVAIGQQAFKNFEQVEPTLQALTGQVTEGERETITRILTEIYLSQRALLSGGEHIIEVEIKKGTKRKYPVWVNAERPSTAVETVMHRWIKDDSQPMAQQVAARASANFANAFDREEVRQIRKIKENLGIQQSSKEQEFASPVVAGQAPQDWYLGKLVPWLATYNTPSYRISIRNLIPEGLVQKKKDRENLRFVLDKWRKSSDSEIKTISKKLSPGLWLAENLKWGMACGGLFAMSLSTFGLTQLSETLAKNSPKSPPKITQPEPIDPGITLSDRISVSDIDSTNFDTGQLIVRFSENGTPDDRLGIRNQGKGRDQISVSGSEVSYDRVTIGELSNGSGIEPLTINLNSQATPEVVQALMRNVTYHNVSESPKLGLRKVEFQVIDDAGAPSNSLTRNIFVTQENKAPKLSVPSTQTANEAKPLVITEIAFNDPDSTKNLSMILNVNRGVIAVKDSIPDGVKAQQIEKNNSNEVRLSGNAKQLSTTLSSPNAITYKGSNDETLKITIDDGGVDIPEDFDKALIWPPNAEKAKTDQRNIKIAVQPSNKIPSIIFSESQQTVDEDAELSFGQITIDDPDSKTLRVTLKVDHGTISVKDNIGGGLEDSEISGNGSNRVTLSGAFNKVKTTLADPKSITYKGKANFNGNDSLKIDVADGGRGNTANMAIIVKSINDPPILAVVKTVTPPKSEPTPRFSSPQQPSTPKPSPVPQQDATNAVVIGDPTKTKNARAGITINAKVLFELPVGSRIQVVEGKYNSDNFLWYKIYSPSKNKYGWMASHLVKLDNQ